MRDRRVYVLITTDGVIIKRVLNRLKDKTNPILVCQSDNKKWILPGYHNQAHADPGDLGDGRLHEQAARVCHRYLGAAEQHGDTDRFDE